VALELVSWPRAFGVALAPPVGSSAAARVGSGLFATRCVACHSVRGSGGTVGPPLTLAATALDPGRFDAALAAHRFERRGLVTPDDGQRAQLFAFLQAVARAPKPELDLAPRDDKKPDEPAWEDAPSPAPPGSPGPAGT
jgi:mono/diheme cytochrome c family protein